MRWDLVTVASHQYVYSAESPRSRRARFDRLTPFLASTANGDPLGITGRMPFIPSLFEEEDEGRLFEFRSLASRSLALLSILHVRGVQETCSRHRVTSAVHPVW